MMNSQSHPGVILTAALIVVFASALFLKEQYGWSVLLVALLIPLLRLEQLTEFVFSLKDGLRAKFDIPSEKIEADIKENNQAVTRENFISFKNIESRVLGILQSRYGGEMKTQVHFVYGKPDKPEFSYTPDGSLITQDTLYFFEVKYVLDPDLVKKIVKDATDYLKTVYEKFSPVAGKRLVIKLILVSSIDIDISKFTAPEGIELEFFKV